MITEGEAGAAGVSAGGAQIHDRTRWSRECGVVGLGRDLSLKTARAPAALSARYNPHRAGARTGPHRFVRYAVRPRAPSARPEEPGPRASNARPRRQRRPGAAACPCGPAEPRRPSARQLLFPAVHGALDIFSFRAHVRGVPPQIISHEKTPQHDVCTGGGATWRGGIRSCGPDPWPCGRPVVPHRILVSG